MVDKKNFLEVMAEMDEFYEKARAEVLRKMAEEMDKEVLEILNKGCISEEEYLSYLPEEVGEIK